MVGLCHATGCLHGSLSMLELLGKTFSGAFLVLYHVALSSHHLSTITIIHLNLWLLWIQSIVIRAELKSIHQ